MRSRNLGDPDFEPTDEDLHELARAAGEHARARHDLAMRQLHERVEKERAAALEAFRIARAGDLPMG